MKGRVLVVDGEATLREFLSRCLEEGGYQVRVCDSLTQASTEVEGFKPHVVILDLFDRGDEGVGWVREVLRPWDGPHVMVLAERASWEWVVESMRLGCRDFLVKPVEEEEILFRLGEIFKKGSFKYKGGGTILPMCCVCGRVKDEKGEWVGLSQYFVRSLGILLSHTYCPGCFKDQMAKWHLPHEEDGHLPDKGGDKFESPENQEDH